MSRIPLFLFFSTAVLVSGCSSSPFNSENRLSMQSYEDQVYSACLRSGKYNVDGKQVEDSRTLCRSHASSAVEASQSYFELYQSDNVTKKCTGSADFNSCVRDYQEQFYDSSIPELIHDMYPSVATKN